MSHEIHYKDHHYIGVIVGPYSTERRMSNNKSEIFVFHVHGNQTYKLNFNVEPVLYITQRDKEEIVTH